MAKRENPRRKEREFNKLQEKQNRSERKREYLENKKNRNNVAADNRIKRNNVEFGTEEIREDLVLGRNAVIEALKSNTTIEYISIAKVTPFKYSEVTDIINRAKRKGEDPFIVILDEIEDPHNLGSIIRTAELCGVHGIIIPKSRNVGVTPTVYKCSAGAIEHMRIAKVTNINATIDQLKEEGIWIYGADIDGKDFSYNTNFSGPCALVIGSEGRGISKLTLKKCDVLVKIPMIGKINSLNASVAGGIMMYEVLKGRLTK